MLIHPETMDISQVERFMAQIQATAFKPEEPMFKAWLILSRDASKLYLVTKHLHCCSDGLDML